MSSGRIYRPLDNSRHEIRVLHIEPCTSVSIVGSSPTLVNCALEYVSLDSEPVYHALSYTWSSISEIGSPRILLNGHEVPVKRNLLLALTQFREFVSLPPEESFAPFPHETRLWVDALCINQADVSERNNQVRQMRQIYQKAEVVNVWLGPELQDSNIGMDMAADIEHIVRSHGYTKIDFDWMGPLMRSRLEGQEDSGSWDSLSDIFRRPYWKRVWIVQELIANYRTYVHVGSKTTHLMPLLTSANTILDMDDLQLSSSLRDKNSIVDGRVIVADRYSFMDPAYEGHHLFDILCNYRHHRCSSPKDKVYGFASLARPYNKKDLVIDYNLSESLVFQAAARFIIEGTKRLEVICAAEQSECRCPQNAHTQLNLPTWVPNWSCVPHAWGRMKFETQIPWKAASDSLAEAKFSSDGRILSCRGLMLGVVERIHVLPQSDKMPWMETLIEFRRLLTFLSDAQGCLVSEDHLAPITKQLWEIFFTYQGLQELVSNSLPLDIFQLLCARVLNSTVLDKTVFEEHGSNIRKIFRTLGERNIFTAKLAMNSSPSRVTLGACAPCCCVGDFVVLLYGCKSLVILRDEINQHRFRMMCGASVNGYMYGEAMGLFAEREFEIY